MGYYDENGKLTIDEIAAAKDMNRLKQSIERLRTSLNALKALHRTCSSLHGLTATAIAEKAQEMMNRITKLIEQLEATVVFMDKTVKRYQQIDKDLKKSIELSEFGGNSR